MVKGVRQTMTKRGTKMAFGTVEGFKGTIDIVLFSKIYEQYGHMLTEDAVLGFSGQVDLSRSEPSFKVKEVHVPEEMKEMIQSEVHIEMKDKEFHREELVDFRAFLQDNNGNSTVYLHLNRPQGPVVIKVSGQIAVSSTAPALQEIRQYPIVKSVWKE